MRHVDNTTNDSAKLVFDSESKVGVVVEGFTCNNYKHFSISKPRAKSFTRGC